MPKGGNSKNAQDAVDADDVNTEDQSGGSIQIDLLKQLWTSLATAKQKAKWLQQKKDLPFSRPDMDQDDSQLIFFLNFIQHHLLGV